MPDYDGPYTFLLDIPTAPTGEPRKRIQIAKLGKGYRDPRYGTFSITADEVKRWAMNLAKLPGGRALIDTDHLADKPGAARNTEAAGWITNVALEDGVPMADVEWTPLGEQAIKDKRYLFFSPSYGPWADEQGTVHKDVLSGGALTNRPFLNMPTVCLAAEPPEFVAPVVESEPPVDSPPAMPELTKIATALGLAADADEAKVLEATTALLAKADETPKTLEVQAAEAGKVLLDKSEYDATKAKAGEATALVERVKTLETERADEKFESAFTVCLDGGQVDAKPETKTEWRELYDLAPEQTIKRLAALPKAVNVTQRREHTKDVPAGGDADSFELHAAAQAYAAEHKVPYEQATIKVLEQQEVAA